MGPIVLLVGVLVVLFGVSAMFAGGSVASATRGTPHSRTYAVVTLVTGAVIVFAGLVMIVR